VGKFISTVYKSNLDAVTEFNKSLLQNDFYQFNAQGRGTKVTYYNINLKKSTLDQGSRLAYSDLGEQSPLRFNKINELLIFQFNRAELNFNNDEFGLESSEVSGESYILPNTIEPTDNDFFTVDHADGKWLFKVRDVDRDTLNNGSNVYKIGWVLDRVSDQDILNNIVEEYQYIDVISGTNVRPVVELTRYKLALKVEEIADNIRNYFIDLFYSDKIQSFTYKWYTEYNMYDPYAIEFMIRNKLVSTSDRYLYIQHQTATKRTFGIEYDRSVYAAFEQRDKSDLTHSLFQAQANVIRDPTSIIATRYENYFELDYRVIPGEANTPFNPRAIIPIIPEELIERIDTNTKFEEGNKYDFLNVIIKYFNYEDITTQDLFKVNRIDFCPVEQIFYMCLFLIYVLDSYTKILLS
jgi:hypothetical protein